MNSKLNLFPVPLGGASCFDAPFFRNSNAFELSAPYFQHFQCYINRDLASNDVAIDELVAKLLSKPVGDVAIHLDNMREEDPDYFMVVQAAEKIDAALRSADGQRKVYTVLHYESWMESTELPTVNGRPVGIENSLTGFHNFADHENHLKAAFAFTRKRGGSFVFDAARLFYEVDSSIEDIKLLVLHYFKQMEPGRDVIHLVGKSNWHQKFRDAATNAGAADDIGKFILDIVNSFVTRGGLAILELEDLELSVASIPAAYKVNPYVLRNMLQQFSFLPLTDEVTKLIEQDPIMISRILVGLGITIDKLNNLTEKELLALPRVVELFERIGQHRLPSLPEMLNWDFYGELVIPGRNNALPLMENGRLAQEEGVSITDPAARIDSTSGIQRAPESALLAAVYHLWERAMMVYFGEKRNWIKDEFLHPLDDVLKLLIVQSETEVFPLFPLLTETIAIMSEPTPIGLSWLKPGSIQKIRDAWTEVNY